MSLHDLTDTQWRAIQPLLPDKARGVPRVDDRRVLNGIQWVLRSGGPWRALPTRYGPPTTCYNRYVRWRKSGLWDRLTAAATATANGTVPSEKRQQRRPTQARGEETRTKILRAALKLFALQGYNRVSTRNIATEAGVPGASLRYYFGNKYGIYEACLASIIDISLQLTDPALTEAEAVLASGEQDPARLIAAYCAVQDSSVDLMIGTDDGSMALLLVRQDLPPDIESEPLMHQESPISSRIFACYVAILQRLSGGNSDHEESLFIALMLNGELIAMCGVRPQMERTGWVFTAKRVRKIKQMLRKHTATILRDHYESYLQAD